jgi:hypothetical protein
MGTALGGSGLVAKEEGVCDVGETKLEDVLTGESAAAGEGDTAGCCAVGSQQVEVLPQQRVRHR